MPALTGCRPRPIIRPVIVGTVVGSVWGARQVVGLAGHKLTRVRVLGTGREVVALDRLGAGPGELVVVANGSRVRDIGFGAAPVKTCIVAIVDGLDGGQ